MQLSVVIVNWKSSDFLDKAIASLEANLGSFEHEVVVIDSGSFDGCGEMLKQKHPQVHFVQSTTNLGFGRANNEAVSRTRGRVLLFLNPDTLIVGDAIQRLHQALVSLPGAGIVGPRLLNEDGTVQETCIRAFPTLLNQVLDSDMLRSRFPESALWGTAPLHESSDWPVRVDAVSGACLMISRARFDAIGGFSTDYFMYGEDMDICLKADRAGLDVYYLPGATVVHFGGKSSANAPANTFAAVMRLESQWRFFRKNESASYAAAYRAVMCVASVLRITALLFAWPLKSLKSGTWSPPVAVKKWLARLRWTLGGERWVRDC
jgi:N-acetylglucosaminyl-diphospho-decaprenol L-rhamnosyltransferase